MTTTPQGLTSPHRHTRPARFPHLEAALAIGAALLLPVFEWLDDTIEPGRFTAWLQDLTPWERVYAALRTGLLVLLATALIAALAACKPVEDIPGRDISPSAGVVIPGPPPVPTATTWEQVGA